MARSTVLLLCGVSARAPAVGLAVGLTPRGWAPGTPSRFGEQRVETEPGAQRSRLTLDPPWTPAMASEKATLTCQGTDGSNRIRVSETESGSHSYQCRGPGAELSPPLALTFLDDWLVLQVPPQAPLEGDTLRLRCRGWKNTRVAQVRFFREQEVLRAPSQEAELLLPRLQLQHSGRYRCQATVNYIFTKESAPLRVTVQELFSVPLLRLEGPAEPPEGATLALGCLSRRSPLRPLAPLQYVFYRDGAVVGGPQGSPQLWLPAVGLAHSGNYSCEAQAETASVLKRSAPVTIRVYRVPVSGVTVAAQPPGAQVAEGDRLLLSCSVAAGTGPLSFSWHRQGSAAPLGTGRRYELRAAQRRDGGRYHCAASNGGTAARSPPLWVTVLVPVAGATIAMARTEAAVPAGENLNLSCSVQAGTAPVTFTWLRDGQELGSGPVLVLGAVGPAHAGTYRCVATNRLGAHRLFRTRSPALALSVTQPRRWQRGAAAGKSRERDPTAPPEPEGHRLEPAAPAEVPEDGEVLYAHVVHGGGTPRGSPRPGPWQEPPVTYAVLPGPHARLRLPSDAYENVP
ncbi:low affinity immunoglobulin gamma Fc region receptor II-a [Pelecanus crispus]|uniref:low affinity immunoglobulin gamma Fc region receptor II-a n=1 Tax=Pelecanus crispus TaxID=36300 RepID=UPI003F5CFC1F